MVELFSGMCETLDLVFTTGNKQASKGAKKGQEEGREEEKEREKENIYLLVWIFNY